MAAGAVHTPHLLMLSGVGPAEKLSRLGIEVIADLPGVGARMQDHAMLPVAMLTSEESPYVGARVARRMTTEVGRVNGLAHDAMIFVAVFDPSTLNLDVDTKGQQAVSLIFNVSRPLSTGWLTMTSNDFRVPPEMHFNFLSDERDLTRMVDGIREIYKLATETQLADIISEIPGLTPDLVNDRASLEEWLRQTVTTGFHVTSTCPMGPPEDPCAVVDQYLAVRDVDSLWIADMSVAPVIPTAFTNITAHMIGERLADWLRDGQD